AQVRTRGSAGVRAPPRGDRRGTSLNGMAPLKPDEARARSAQLFGGKESRFLAQGTLMIEAMPLRFEGRLDDSLAAWHEGDAILAELGLAMIRHVIRQVPAECESARVGVRRLLVSTGRFTTILELSVSRVSDRWS